MFAPDSVGLLVALGVVGLAAMLLALRRGHLALRMVAGIVALSVVFVAGAASVNVYFGYFTSWSDVTSGLGGGPAAAAVASGPKGLSAASVQQTLANLPATAAGNLLTIDLPGPRSHLNRRALVWLPPQYREAAYAHTRFPVLELIPGTPGQPADWVTNIHVTAMLAALVAQRRIGPMVVVLAPSNPPIGGGHGEECTNKPIKGAQDATYLARDVPADIQADFRVYPTGARWAIAGYSSGGYCAAKLPLQYPGVWGAAADLDGYLSPLEDGGLWGVIFYKVTPALRANDVSVLLETHPILQLPRFYLVAGTGNREDVDDLVTLRTLLRGRTPVTATVDAGGHTFRAWRDQLPATLEWVWRQIGSAHPVGTVARHRATARRAVSVVAHPAR